MIYHFGDCTLDTARDEIRRSGELIHTPPQARMVLRYLLEHRDRVVSREELLAQCWPRSYVSDATLTSCLRRVRQAIGQTPSGPTLIATLHRRGYRFVAAVTELAETASAVTPDVETAPRVRPEAGSGVPPAEPFAPLWADDPPGAAPLSAVEREDAYRQSTSR
jgi:DNA-binding winged helix-turn-helix (wHTH) protein